MRWEITVRRLPNGDPNGNWEIKVQAGGSRGKHADTTIYCETEDEVASICAAYEEV